MIDFTPSFPITEPDYRYERWAGVAHEGREYIASQWQDEDTSYILLVRFPFDWSICVWNALRSSWDPIDIPSGLLVPLGAWMRDVLHLEG